MKTGRNEPSSVSVVAHVSGAAVVGKVGQNNAQVDEAGEDTSAETTHSGRGNLSEIDGSYNGCLANS
jgi:hypothetical protein